MRKLILIDLQRIKEKENGYRGEKWNDFNVGYQHISIFIPDGLPSDEMLLEFYKEVLKIHFSEK